MTRTARALLGLRRIGILAALAAAGCGGGSGPEWVHLARDFVPSPVETGPLGTTPGKGLLPRVARPFEKPGANIGAWLETDIERGDWKATHWAGVYRLEVPVGGGAGWPPEGGAAQKLSADGQEIAFMARTSERNRPDSYPPGTFTVDGNQLFLILEAGAELPASTTLSVWADRGRGVEGTWRVTLGRYTAPGIPVWSGHSQELRVDLPAKSVLRLTTAHRSSGTPGATPPTFVLSLGGRELFRHTAEQGGATVVERHRIELPSGGQKHAQLRFAVEGEPALAAFLDPVVGPAQVGTYGERPWGEARPDIVLYLADTFRADNMALHGGQDGLTPVLDRFAEDCLRFERAWAPSSWTLPSQASMFTGLYPRQHGAIDSKVALSAEALTVAEELRARGYRTGAVTGAVYLSHKYGMDQGFDWFDEHMGSTLAELRERVNDFLAADDGRPVFLFVQTYRVHSPYIVSEETLDSHGKLLAIEEQWSDLFPQMQAEVADWRHGQPLTPRMEELLERFSRLYRGGVVDLDRGFGDLLADLDGHGLDDSGYLVFTSDHGEAFGEHGDIWHGTGVWEEEIAIPLLIRGPGVAPAARPEPVSLVDLPHTFAEMAGFAPPAGWHGTSLLSLGEDRPVFSFGCFGARRPTEMALRVVDKKVILTESFEALRAGEITHAFDLASDPGERTDLAGRKWSAELLRRLRPDTEEYLEERVGPTEARLDVEDVENLRALGYVDE